MSLDYLCEEGPAHREDIEIPFHIIFSSSTILIFLYGIHLNAHLYFFAVTTRIFLWTYNFLSGMYHVLFYWYFILQFNHCVGQKLTTLDSTQSRDHEEDKKNLPVTAVPAIDTFVTVRPQIIFFQQNYFEELGSTPTYVANTIYPAQNFLNLSVTVSTLHIYDIPLLYHDQRLQ